MDKKELKKILAGLSIAALLAGISLTTYGCATTQESGTKPATQEAPAPGG
jgi:radical SAM modification target selenobiotic family peptide